MIDKTICVYGENGERWCQTFHKFTREDWMIKEAQAMFKLEYGKKVKMKKYEITCNDR